MIRLRLGAFADDKGDLEIPIIDSELLSAAVERCLENVPLDREAGEVFQVLVNGHTIEKDLWAFTKLKEVDVVLVAPKLGDGDNSGLFRQALILTVTVIASVYLTPAGGATIASAFAVAGVSIAASLLFTALIPPAVLPNGGSDLTNDYSSSQMYSVTGQANVVKKYGSVPKVYGTHKIYPIVAANPYTEILTDPASGELAQYLYVIYDFGLGPVMVSQLKIGDTPIEQYSDVQYRLVDFNKPLTSDGPWDDVTHNTLEFYKGDPDTESLAITLNGNESSGGAVDTYQAIRNTPINTDGVNQTITLSLVNPQGLFAYSSTGAQSSRSIDMKIYFAPVGTDDWKAFNDVTAVSSFSSAVGSEAQAGFNYGIIPLNIANVLGPGFGEVLDLNGAYTQLRTDTWGIVGGGAYQNLTGNPAPGIVPNFNASGTVGVLVLPVYWGYPKGATSVVFATDVATTVGSVLFFNGSPIGTVASIAAHATPGYSRYTLASPLANAIEVYQNFSLGWLGTVGQPYYHYTTNTLLAKTLYLTKTLVGSARITRQTTNPAYSTFVFTPKVPGQYKVRVTRVNTFSYSGYSSQVQDSLSWIALSTRFDRSPIVTDKRHTFLELRIRATNQLNGSISNLSAVCNSVLDVWNGTAWVKQITSNPAWVFCDLLTGEVNKSPIDKSRLHLPSILEWRDFADVVPDAPPSQTFVVPRFSCNFVLDFETTLQSMINMVCSAGQSSLNFVDGKYGVLIDKYRDVPVQIFTPRNSKNFTSSRSYPNKPDALKVRYIDPFLDWSQAEAIVYDQGFDFETATVFDEIETFACTSPEQAWRYGRYMLAQNRLRQETISIDVDFEYLASSRGDYVQITQDVMKVGGTPARVKLVVGNQVTIDDAIESGPFSYGYTFRASDGQIKTDTLTIINDDTFDLDGDLPEVGDLIIIGEVSKIVYDCLIKSITPGDNLTAQIVLIEKADAVYDAESTDTFPAYDPQLSNTVDSNFAPPPEVVDLAIVDSAYECSGNTYRYFVTLDWEPPTGSAYENFEIFVDSGTGYALAGTTRNSLYEYTVLAADIGKLHTYKVIAVSSSGKKLDLGSVSSVTNTPLSKTSPPSDVAFLASDITNEVLQLSWEQVPDCDCREYLIRYSPLTGDVGWESTIPLLRVDRNTTLGSAQARTGTYLIKAIDFNGNESVNAARAITTIPNLFNLNIISEITDFPTLPGVFDLTKNDGAGALTLANSVLGGVETSEFYSEGYYYYQDLLDLGNIFTVRLQSQIQAEGYTVEDLMSSWITLDSVLFLSNSKYSEWDVEAQYRSTNELNVMANWVLLSSISPISEGNQDDWTLWRKFVMGDATGRIFQFRLKLISRKTSVTPRVFEGTIRADMPDRTLGFENIIVPIGGYNVVYDPPFKGPGTSPNIQVSIDNAQSGDYWTLTNKSLNGFTIDIFNKNDNPVGRQVDIHIKGYGYLATAVI